MRPRIPRPGPMTAGLLLTLLYAAANPAMAERPIAMDAETRAILTDHLQSEALNGVHWALHQVDQRTLGPQQPTEAQREQLAGPDQRVTLTVDPDETEGSGTADDPYIDAIGTFLDDLDRSDVKVIVPAGYYREWDVVIPESVWLVGDTGAVIQPPADPDTDDGQAFITLDGVGAGATHLEIDGGTTARFPGRSGAIHVANGSDQAVVAYNHIHHLTGMGVSGGSAEGALIFGNRIEKIGYSGVRVSSGFDIESNVIRDTGMYRVGGMGWGGDGVIVRGDCRIVNNRIVHSRRHDPVAVFGLDRLEDLDPAAVRNTARHALATQKANGSVRCALALADHSNENEVVGNVALQLTDAGQWIRHGPAGSEREGLADIPTARRPLAPSALSMWIEPDGAVIYDAVTRLGIAGVVDDSRFAGNAVLG